MAYKRISQDKSTISASNLIDTLMCGDVSDEEYLLEAIDFIAAKAEISGRLFISYDAEGNKTTSELCSANDLYLAAKLLIDYTPTHYESAAITLKRINAAYKLLERCRANERSASDAKEFYKALESKSKHIAESSKLSGSNPVINVAPPKAEGLTTLPITVLFWEGPIARAYLATLKSCGYRPKRIINLVSSVDLANGKPIGRLMPKFLRLKYCESVHQARAHYWSKRLQKTLPKLFSDCKRAAREDLEFSDNTYQESYSNLPLSSYCDEVINVLVSNLRDPLLVKTLQHEQGNILFTGGGIVPESVLGIPGIKFLHIHPGKLPHIRGADCTLWSYLLANQPSASLFYMAPGIDDGDTIISSYLPPSRIQFGSELDNATKYRAIYAFYDPWVRAAVLRQGLVATNSFSDISASPQDHSQGMSFYFMDARLKPLAFEKIFI